MIDLTIDTTIRSAIHTAVNSLIVSMGNIHDGWRLHNLQPTAIAGIYDIELVVNQHYLLKGIAIICRPDTYNPQISIFLDSASLYKWLYLNLNNQLQQYTAEHPWIAGV
jgi:hypothetical protein